MYFMYSTEPLPFLILFVLVLLLFFTERFSYDLSALFGLVVLVCLGYVSATEAFDGFSSDAVILMAATFFITGAIRRTGVAERLARFMVRLSGGSERRNIGVVTVIAALLSSVMNNVAATALLLPAVSGVAQRSRISPSKLFIPLSFAVLLGGTLTLIGTSSNMIASEILQSRGYQPLLFFEFTPMGFLLTVAGIIFLVFFSGRLLPGERKDSLTAMDKELFELYRMNERLFAMTIPSESSLDGKSLKELRFGKVIGAEVLAIRRGGKLIMGPGANDVVHGGDKLFVRGRIEELHALLRLQGAKVKPFSSKLPGSEEEVGLLGGRVRITKKITSRVRTLGEVNLRAEFRVHAVAIERGDERIYENIARVPLQEGDFVVVIGGSEPIEALKNHPALEGVEIFSIESLIDERVFYLHLPEKTNLGGVRIRDSRFGELVNLVVIGLVRNNSVMLAVSGDEVIGGGDTLIVVGHAADAALLAELSMCTIDSDPGSFEFESPETGLMEVVLSPRSKLISKTVEQLQFADKYGFRVLAIWRDGLPIRARFAQLPFRFGDALLLHGPRNKMHMFSRNTDFVTLRAFPDQSERADRARWAIASLIIMVILSAFGFLPAHVAAVVGAFVAVLSGSITMEEGYREVDWRAVLLVSCLLPFGKVFSQLGFPDQMAQWITYLDGSHGVLLISLFLILLSSIMSQLLDSTITVVILVPLAIEVALKNQLPVHFFALQVAFGASIAFLAPFSHRAHLLVMGPGGYRGKDFWAVGGLLTVVSVVVLIVGSFLLI